MDVSQLTGAKAAESIRHVFLLPDNQYCVDCKGPLPEWASIGFGTFVCIQCAGYHRSLGTHITLVRSVKLDAWDQESSYIEAMELGGNKNFNSYTESLAKSNDDIYDEKCQKYYEKYQNPKLLYYSEVIKSKLEGREPKPFDLEEWCEVAQPHSPPKSSLQSENDFISSASKVW